MYITRNNLCMYCRNGREKMRIFAVDLCVDVCLAIHMSNC